MHTCLQLDLADCEKADQFHHRIFLYKSCTLMPKDTQYIKIMFKLLTTCYFSLGVILFQYETDMLIY